MQKKYKIAACVAIIVVTALAFSGWTRIFSPSAINFHPCPNNEPCQVNAPTDAEALSK